MSSHATTASIAAFDRVGSVVALAPAAAQAAQAAQAAPPSSLNEFSQLLHNIWDDSARGSRVDLTKFVDQIDRTLNAGKASFVACDQLCKYIGASGQALATDMDLQTCDTVEAKIKQMEPYLRGGGGSKDNLKGISETFVKIKRELLKQRKILDPEAFPSKPLSLIHISEPTRPY